jgi:hypothetical protein
MVWGRSCVAGRFFGCLSLGILLFLACPKRIWALILEVQAPAVLSISDSPDSLMLTFTDFLPGAKSDVQVATYRIRANQMSAGYVQGAVSGALTSPFPQMVLEADVLGYRNLGTSGYARLKESVPGYRKMEGIATSLADKIAGTGVWDLCLDGELTVAWRAGLTSPAAAGQERRTLILTLRDGH